MDCPPGKKNSGRCREVAVSGGSTVCAEVANSLNLNWQEKRSEVRAKFK